MRVIFVYFGPLDVNSGIQAFHFGNELTELGWDVTLAGLGDPRRIEAVGEPQLRVHLPRGAAAPAAMGGAATARGRSSAAGPRASRCAS